ncbi:MAG: AAA family ATPase [Pyrinomonadaceae bacterium]
MKKVSELTVEEFKATLAIESDPAVPATVEADEADEATGYKPSILSAKELLAKSFPQPKYAVDGLLPEGVTVLVGKPKLGKSWLTIGIAVAVASGGKALGTIPVEKGDVLLLGLEDGARRLQNRLNGVLNGGPVPAGLDVATEWRRIDDGGLDDIEGWLQNHPDARLVVVDTLKRVRPPERPGRIYNDDYDAIAPLADLAKRYAVAIVVVHHTRKQDSEDPVDLVSGSTGLTGAADGVCVLKRMRLQSGAELLSFGRDFEESSLALEWDKDILQWKCVGEAAEFKMSEERRAILDVIRKNGGKAKPKEIAEALGKPPATVRKNLWDMKNAGQVYCDASGYYYESDTFGDTGNAGNGVTGVTAVNEFYNHVPKEWDDADLPF